jgi:hypothetical protein
MSTEDNTGGPAFPALGRWGDGPTPQSALQQDGMTLRDYFAAKAMQAFIERYSHESDVSRNAYKVADAMLKARQA